MKYGKDSPFAGLPLPNQQFSYIIAAILLAPHLTPVYAYLVALVYLIGGLLSTIRRDDP